MGAEVQGHPTRNQPHKGSGKGPSSSLHGHPGTTNRIFIHRWGAALPPSCKVQNAVDRAFDGTKDLTYELSYYEDSSLSAQEPSSSVRAGGS